MNKKVRLETKMKISVVIPCFNDYEFIEKAINSAAYDPHEEIEIIVVDDGSDKRTKNVLRKLKPKYDKLIQQENRGVSYARNIGIKNASHAVIVVLDSDDYFEPDFFKRAYRILTEDSEVKIVTCWSRRFNEAGTIDIIKVASAELNDFLKYNAAMGSIMFRKTDWYSCGGYDETMSKGYEDWEYYIRLLQNGGKSYSIPEKLFNYRIREKSRTKSANKFRADLVSYIYRKHKPLYSENLDDVFFYYIKRIEVAENSEKKLKDSIEYKIGKLFLQPLRNIKRLLISSPKV